MKKQSVLSFPLDRDTARALALEVINRHQRGRRRGEDAEDYVILDEQTLDKGFYFVFFYQSKRYLETGDLRAKLYGSTMLIVEKDSGAFHELGAGRSLESQLQHYEAKKLEE
ncbi:MAG: hypothetical protein HXY40_16920 [Chloroflexi bacterium]|nr:hypothetical protein [Chloroflexota bacterium]